MAHFTFLLSLFRNANKNAQLVDHRTTSLSKQNRTYSVIHTWPSITVIVKRIAADQSHCTIHCCILQHSHCFNNQCSFCCFHLDPVVTTHHLHHPSAPIKSGMETFWYRLAQVHLGKNDRWNGEINSIVQRLGYTYRSRTFTDAWDKFWPGVPPATTNDSYEYQRELNSRGPWLSG